MAKGPIGPVEALKIALEKEKNSVTLYRKLSLEAKAASGVLEFLINEEMKHVKLIEDRIRELTTG